MTAIIILGAAVWPNGPSPALRRRTLHAATIWHAGRAQVIIPCGGLGQYPPTEAAVMHDLLTDAGVPKTAICIEDRSTNTLENIRNALPLLPGPDVIIVTDTYHAKRAQMVAAHFHLRAVLECPRPERLYLKQNLREVLALPAYALKLRRTPRT